MGVLGVEVRVGVHVPRTPTPRTPTPEPLTYRVPVSGKQEPEDKKHTLYVFRWEGNTYEYIFNILITLLI